MTKEEAFQGVGLLGGGRSSVGEESKKKKSVTWGQLGGNLLAIETPQVGSDGAKGTSKVGCGKVEDVRENEVLLYLQSSSVRPRKRVLRVDDRGELLLQNKDEVGDLGNGLFSGEKLYETHGGIMSVGDGVGVVCTGGPYSRKSGGRRGLYVSTARERGAGWPIKSGKGRRQGTSKKEVL